MTEITLGHLRDSLHAGCAAAVARVLDAHEVGVSFFDLDRAEVAAAMASGEVDLLVSAWMPGPDDALVSPSTRVIGELYKPIYVWALTWDHGAASIADVPKLGADRLITTPELAPVFDAVKAGALGGCNFAVEFCDDDAVYERVRRAIGQGERAIVALEQPHAVFHTEGLTVLDDPAHVLGRERSARIVLRESVAACADPDMLDELDEMMLGNKVMSALDHAIRVEGTDPEEAAEAWQRGRLLPR